MSYPSQASHVNRTSEKTIFAYAILFPCDTNHRPVLALDFDNVEHYVLAPKLIKFKML